MPAKITVVEEAPQNTDENSQREQSELGQENALRQAEAYGALQAEYRQAQERIAQLELRLTATEATAGEVAALRAELAQLRAEVFEMEEEIGEENSDVTLIEPEIEPEPVKEEPPPDLPKESIFELILRL
jgi:hypothetical protein